LDEKKVRQALQQGINMETVRGEEYAKRALDYPILDVQLEGLSYPELGKYDVEAAKKLIVDAGYTYTNNELTKDGMPVSLKVAYLENSELNPVAERYIEELKKLGFEVVESKFGEAEILSGQDFYTTVIQPRNYDILLYEVNLGVSVDPFVYYSSHQANSHGWNLSNYSNALADDALLSARTTDDADLRKAKYESFLGYWVDDVPAVGIYRSDLSYYYSDSVQIYSEDVRMTDEYDRFADVRNFATQKSRVNITP
jgi:ABC-type transport system substrate-binding protein